MVFFAVGFETTAPANAMSVYQAKQMGVKNYSMLVSHVLVPPAMEVDSGLARRTTCRVPGRRSRLHGHGLKEYEPIAKNTGFPLS